MHKIKTLLRPRRLVSARPEELVHDVARRMTEARVGIIGVLEGRHLVGVFSERDLMTRVMVAGLDARSVPVAQVMTRDVVTAHPDERRSACIEKMRKASCRHLPVIEDGEVVAMLSMRDLLQDEIEEQEQEIHGLRAYMEQEPLR